MSTLANNRYLDTFTNHKSFTDHRINKDKIIARTRARMTNQLII